MATTALKVLGLDYNIKYEQPHLDGQYRKDVSSKKLLSLIPDFKFTSLEKGLKQVYDKISK